MARRLLRQALRPADGKCYDTLPKANGAVQLLSLHPGIKCLELESTLMDPSAPSNTFTIPGHLPGEIEVAVLSNFSPSFRRRATQEQVDRLSEIMGKQKGR